MIRRINLYGSPCCGKTGTASEIFAELKKRNKNAYLLIDNERKKPMEHGLARQVSIFANQFNNELNALSENDIVVTDTPLRLINFYTNRIAFEWSLIVTPNTFYEIAQEMDNRYNSLNIFLERNCDVPYSAKGRLHNEHESLLIQHEMKEHLNHYNIKYETVKCGDTQTIMKILKESGLI